MAKRAQQICVFLMSSTAIAKTEQRNTNLQRQPKSRHYGTPQIFTDEMMDFLVLRPHNSCPPKTAKQNRKENVVVPIESIICTLVVVRLLGGFDEQGSSWPRVDRQEDA
eukprot:scaffold505_cov179-Amphora_coffeaeformis.AAC.4